MERVLDVARYIVDEYGRISGEKIDELKLQKLLYFAQRESLAITGEPMFAESFEGWRFGPVCREVHASFFDGELISDTAAVSDETAYILNNVLLSYGAVASWKLGELSHKEYSWRQARRGLSADENGSVPLTIEDVKKDAEKIRPYDHVWDMYYDEFEDARAS